MRTRLQVIVCVRGVGTRRWIAEELADGPSAVVVMNSVDDAVQVLARRNPKHILVVDVDELNAQELIELSTARSFGWKGVFVALGNVPDQLKSGLSVDHVVPRPLGSEGLRAIISGLDATADTAEITLVDR